MTDTRPARPDDLLGICAALGHDFGFDPLWLRIALAAGLLWRPELMVGAYLLLGLLVLASRIAFPDHRPAAIAAPVTADNDADANALAEAA